MLKNNKSLGQHWLKDRGVLDEISNFLLPTDAKLCVEIGPGLGTLTSSLLRRFDKVLAVEYDKRLAENLPKSFPGKNLMVVNQDFLKYDLEKIKEPYVVAGNIPYYITSPIIEKLLSTKNRPKKIVLLIQKEVADRILAFDKKESVLSLAVKNRAKVTPGFIVKKELFTPPPKVDSAIIILEPLARPQVGEDVINLIKVGFGSPRKKLVKNLLHNPEAIKSAFSSLNIDSNARPADLSLEQWQKLLHFLA